MAEQGTPESKPAKLIDFNPDPMMLCRRYRSRCLESDPRVKTLFDGLRKLGCDPGPLDDFVQCATKAELGDKEVTGGFAAHNEGDDAPYVSGGARNPAPR